MKFSPLRDKILTLALTGQLVEQRASEPEVQQIGPAPAPDEVPFALPAKWRWVKFESVLELISGRDLTLAQISSTPDEVMTPYVTGASQIEHGAILINRWTAQPSVISEEGDVLLTCKGTVGKLALNSYGSMHIARQIMAVRCGLLCEPSFVLMYLQSFMSKLKANAKGLIPGITRKDVLGLWLPLPPLEEQRRIVVVLDDLMARLDQMEQAYSELTGPMSDHFRNLVLQQAISGQLVPQLDSEPEVEQVGPAPAPDEVPFAIPEKWKWVQLKEVALYNPDVCADDELEVSFAPLEKLSDGFGHKLTFDQVRRWGEVKNGYKRFQDGDVLFAKIHPSFQNRKSGLVTKARNGIGCGSTEYCVYRCREPLLNQYLLWFFKTAYFIELGKRTFKGTVGQQRVNLDVINAMYIPLPPLEEQRRIVTKLEEILAGVKQLSSLKEFGVE